MLEGLLTTLASLLAALSPPPSLPPVSPPPVPEPVTVLSPPPVVAQEPRTVQIESSAYCLTGRTASGEYVRPGIAASNALFGRRVRVLDGPLAGTVLEVRDRHSPRYRMLLDIWMADCYDAIRYGRRTITAAME